MSLSVVLLIRADAESALTAVSVMNSQTNTCIAVLAWLNQDKGHVSADENGCNDGVTSRYVDDRRKTDSVGCVIVKDSGQGKRHVTDSHAVRELVGWPQQRQRHPFQCCVASGCSVCWCDRDQTRQERKGRREECDQVKVLSPAVVLCRRWTLGDAQSV